MDHGLYCARSLLAASNSSRAIRFDPGNSLGPRISEPRSKKVSGGSTRSGRQDDKDRRQSDQLGVERRLRPRSAANEPRSGLLCRGVEPLARRHLGDVRTAYRLIEEEWALQISGKTGHLAAEHIDQLRQLIDATASEKPPHTGDGCVNAGSDLFGAKSERSYGLFATDEVPFADKDRTATIAFDCDCQDDHQWQREGNKHARDH
jgi:hypothetical protein